MKTCHDCLYQTICDVYSNLGITDIPANDITPCELFKAKADVVEVVRCKDCEFYDESILGKKHGGRCTHIHLSCYKCGNCRKTTPHNFCSYGKRKENEDD